MLIRDLTQNQYKQFCEELSQKARTDSLDTSYTVDMQINGIEYILKVQPERRNKVAILQVLRIGKDGHELIIRNHLLAAFLELLLYQGVR